MSRPPHDVGEFRDRARRRLPRFAFDFIDGGAGRETGLKANHAAFDAVRLVPRVLSSSVTRSTASRLLGEKHALPFGAAPIGLANLAWAGADRGIAGACAAANIPFILSTAGTMRIEDAARIAGGKAWFQLYVGRDAAIVDDLITRALAAGIRTLVVTVDLPAPGKRLRDLRNGFALPFRITPRMIADLLAHPAWSLATLRAGPPRFANLDPYHSEGGSARSLAQLMAAQSSARLDWDELARLRDRWPHRLIVKGVLHPDDAVRVFRIGGDAVIVSNHGARQLDAALAPIAALPAIRRAVGEGACLLLDGGVAGGEDVVRALALGADFVLLGRPFVFAAAARGPRRGPTELIALLTDEIDRAMACCGCAAVGDLRGAALWKDPAMETKA